MISTFLKFAIAFGLLYWMIRGNAFDFEQAKAVILSAYLLPAFLLVIAGVLVASERFKLLLRAQGILLSRFECLKLYLIGLFFSFAIPGGVGGDVVKAYYLQKSHGKVTSTAPYTVVFDRFIGLYVLVLLAFLSVVFDFQTFLTNTELQPLALFIVGIAVAMTVGIVLSVNSTVRAFCLKLPLGPARPVLERVSESVQVYSRQPRIFVHCLFFSLLGHLFSIGTLVVAGFAVGGEDIPILAYFFAGSLGFMVSALPIAPAGIGVGQAAFFYLFNLYMGTKSSIGPTLITVFQILLFVLSLSGLYFYLKKPRRS